jgi:hypothetical protein
VRPDDEQIRLHRAQGFEQLFLTPGRRNGHPANERVELINVAITVDALLALADARPPEQARRAVVAGFSVDLHRGDPMRSMIAARVSRIKLPRIQSPR